ncbi:antA/AntB antirepressor family protein [Fusicatenibacter saccharivorans]|uniref:Phage anti-repressor protein n=1 Tax=Fusicatenibacter saccharivorans TaxID=1150298 RepID=A0A174K5G0_9FIRM|nr:antA/AntB antirepressor family protein [Fusicatenibacter saccharivorans]CUP04449.1 Phage anti-repressor protein [Fusicatenibacter saccharivorans]
MNERRKSSLSNLTRKICDKIESGMVPVYKTDEGEYVVNGTELHRTLGPKTQFTHWIRRRIRECDAVENEDYQMYLQDLDGQHGGGGKQEYIIKLDTAKEMAMLERNEKGKQVRRYFIEVEKKYKQTGSVEKTLAQFIRQQTEFNEKMLSLMETQTPQIESREPAQSTATNPFNPNKDLVKERLAKLNELVTEVQELHGLKRNMTLHFLYDTIAEDCDTNLNSYLTVYRTETGNKEASTLHVIAASDRFYEQALKNFDYAIKRKKVFG